VPEINLIDFSYHLYPAAARVTAVEVTLNDFLDDGTEEAPLIFLDDLR